MIFISAQPDTTYFTWQLEIQLRNLNSLGVLKENIQVVVAYNKEMGLNPDFQKFIEENNHLGTFFIYEDQRDKPKYTSSVRPNILKQHFIKYPELTNETLMYHDSDILFSRIPQIDQVEENDICYVSDTRNYLDINYIRQTSSEELLEGMLAIVGLSKENLIQENEQTGGAQYVLKGISTDFWKKVEKDAEDLFILMKDYNTKLWEEEYSTKKEYRSKKRGIQAWCADMWAVLWNLWLMDKKVEIHSEMDFSWPYNPIEDWSRLAIQHYSGNIDDKNKYFKKGEYVNYMPWYDDELNSIPADNCSYEIVQWIKSRKNELDQARKVYPNVEVILYSHDKSENLEHIFNVYKKYIHKYLDITITKSNQNFDANQKEKLNNEKISYLIIPINQLLHIHDLTQILDQPTGLSISVNELFLTDVLFAEAFSKMLEIELLTNNKGKFNQGKESQTIYWINKNSNQMESEKPFSNLKQIVIEEAYSLS